MLMKSIAAGLAGTALLATVAFAQNPNTTTTPADKSPAASTATTTTTSASGEWRTSKMDGIKVYNEANENIGSINDLLMDKSGNIKIAVIGVGGFLGMGQHDIKVELSKLKFVDEPARSASNTTTTTTGAATNRPATTTTSTSSGKRWYPDHAILSGATKDQLKAMPQFKFD
jgi:hypothetical protein